MFEKINARNAIILPRGREDLLNYVISYRMATFFLKITSIFKNGLFYLFMCACTYGCMQATVHLWMSEDMYRQLVFLPLYVLGIELRTTELAK